MRDRNYELERELNKIEGTNKYTNCVIATVNERGAEITETWLIRHFLGLVEEGIMEYDEALKAKELYTRLLLIINE